MTKQDWLITMEISQSIAILMLMLGWFSALAIQLRMLRRERSHYRMESTSNVATARMLDTLDQRIYTLESRSVTAGVTLRNPTPGETR